jgi:hypothetical protein
MGAPSRLLAGLVGAAVLALVAPLGATAATVSATATHAASAFPAASTGFGDSTDPQDDSEFACADLLVIGARGSGESGGSTNAHGDVGLGKMVGYAVDRLHDTLDATRDVRYVGLDYPALATDVLTDDISLLNTDSLSWGGQSAYMASIDADMVEMSRLLRESAASCPDERWILVGYSQGALVIDQALSAWTDARRFAGIIRIADPGRRVSQAAPNRGTATAGNGISTVTGSQVIAFPFVSDAAVTVDLCDVRDLVCDTSNWIAHVVSSAPPGVSAALTPAHISAGIAVHEGYSEARVKGLVDTILPRIRAVPIPADRHTVITRCGPSVGANGLAVMTEKASVAARPSGEAAVTWNGTYYSASDGTSFAIQPDGTWTASLRAGHYSIPLTVSAPGWLPTRAWLDISVGGSCEEMYTCGPEHAAPTGAISQNSYNLSVRAQPPAEYDDTIVAGQILCPSGIPAVGVAVSYCPDPGYNCRTGYWVTDDRGYYRMPLEHADQDIWINTYLSGYPSMTGGDPRASMYDPDAVVHVSAGTTTRVPTYRFTQYATITVRTQVQPSSWFTGAPDSRAATGYVYATDDDPDYAANRLDISPTYPIQHEFCLDYDGSGCWDELGLGDDPLYPGDTVAMRVLPGTHHVYWMTSSQYSEWWGSDEVDPCTYGGFDAGSCPEEFSDRVPASATAVTLAPGESVDLGTKSLSNVSFVSGVVYDVRGADVAPLPVNAYRYLNGQWVFTDAGDWESARVQGDSISQTRWSFGALPGLHKIVLNDPRAVGYDPDYETLYYPGVRTLAAATPVQIDRGIRLFDLYTEFPAEKGSPEAGRGTVSGTVTDSAGAPLANMIVSINGPEYDFALTDVRGNYAISGVPAGSYTAYAHDSKGHEQWWKLSTSEGGSTPITVSAGVDRADIDFTLDVTAPVVQRFWPGRPTVTGTAKVGSNLTANPDLAGWTPMPTTVTYQWLRNGIPIAGATGSTLALTTADADACIAVSVTGNKAGYAALTQTTDCRMVTRETLVGTTPVITGTPKLGASLTAKPGAWTSGAALTYQWYRGSSALPGATKTTYTPTAADVGHRIAVEVTGSRSGLTPLVLRSSAVTVAAGALTASKPRITGTPAVGGTLTAKAGTWTAGTAFRYQWYASGKAIAKATAPTLTLTKAHAGRSITVRVAGVKTGYTTKRVDSAATSKVMIAPAPKIAGTASVGKKLTAKPGAWTSGTRLTYQWFANGTAIRTANTSTYTIRSSQRGKKITVKVTGKKSGYATVTRVSAATARVR